MELADIMVLDQVYFTINDLKQPNIECFELVLFNKSYIFDMDSIILKREGRERGIVFGSVLDVVWSWDGYIRAVWRGERMGVRDVRMDTRGRRVSIKLKKLVEE